MLAIALVVVGEVVDTTGRVFVETALVVGGAVVGGAVVTEVGVAMVLTIEGVTGIVVSVADVGGVATTDTAVAVVVTDVVTEVSVLSTSRDRGARSS